VVAIEFDMYCDSNGFSNARLLRQHYGYKGELRAIGDVPHKKLSFLSQAGFDTYTVSGKKHPARSNGVTPLGRFDFSAIKHSGRYEETAS
jgi:uncharacterized protein (DUF934 family)